MAETIVISGVKPYDGEYPLDIEEEPLTTLEWRWVKKISGYLPLTVNEGFAGGDPDLVIAFAVIALRRGGKIAKETVLAVAERLSDVGFDGAAIQMRFADDEKENTEATEDDAGPPEPAASTSPKPSSGGSSSPSSDQPASPPSPTGTEDSGTHMSVPV